MNKEKLEELKQKAMEINKLNLSADDKLKKFFDENFHELVSLISGKVYSEYRQALHTAHVMFTEERRASNE